MTGCGETTFLVGLECGGDGNRVCYEDVTRVVEAFGFAHDCDVTSIDGATLGRRSEVSLGVSGCGERASYQRISGKWVLEASPAQAAAEQADKDAAAAAAAAAAAKQ